MWLLHRQLFHLDGSHSTASILESGAPWEKSSVCKNANLGARFVFSFRARFIYYCSLIKLMLNKTKFRDFLLVQAEGKMDSLQCKVLPVMSKCEHSWNMAITTLGKWSLAAVATSSSIQLVAFLSSNSSMSILSSPTSRFACIISGSCNAKTPKGSTAAIKIILWKSWHNRSAEYMEDLCIKICAITLSCQS